MKIFIFCIVFLMALTGCEPDPRTQQMPAAATVEIMQRSFGDYPANADNPCDIAGELFYSISESYIVANYSTGSADNIIQRVETLADSDADFLFIKGTDYDPVQSTTVHALLGGDSWMLADAISTSGLGSTAQLMLSGFLDAVYLHELDKKPYDEIHQYILDFEKSVANASLTITEKKTIFTISSITRHGLFFARKQKQKPRDRNWDMTMGAIIATVEGTRQSFANGITLPVITGIASNNF